MPTFEIRRATPADAEVIGWHRARMFQDMGRVPAELFEAFRARSVERLRPILGSGEYVGWFVTEPGANPERIVAGAGVIVRAIPPVPWARVSGETVVYDGKQGLILNVFTEPEWRRRGLARRLMEAAMAWCREQGIENVVLYASDDGRALYQELGFAPTNEMRLRV